MLGSATARDGDVISVEYGGQPLAMAGGGVRYMVRPGYESRVGELQQKLRDGFVFTKFGRLKMGATAATKAQTLRCMTRWARSCGRSAAIRRGTRGSVIPFYGNLLGAFLLTRAEMLAFERSDPDRVEARLDHYSDDD